MESKKLEDNNPPLWLCCMSEYIDIKKSLEESGIIDSINTEKVSLRLSTGINGIKLSINSKNGKIAIKKLKATLPALAFKAPFTNPFKYISPKS